MEDETETKIDIATHEEIELLQESLLEQEALLAALCAYLDEREIDMTETPETGESEPKPDDLDENSHTQIESPPNPSSEKPKSEARSEKAAGPVF